MEKYLTVITTILVATQIVRLAQNTLSLRHQTKLIKAQLGQIRDIGDEDIARRMEVDKMLIEVLPMIAAKYEEENDAE